MIRRILLAAVLVSTAAQADCPPPVEIVGPGINPQSATESYVTALDAYGDCLRDEAPTLAPLDRYAALRTYAATFATMQAAVDAYNAALRSATPAP